jgi:ferredoxin
VTDILRHLSYADGYGDFRLARESYRELPRRVQRASCHSCPACTIICPHGVRVSERVARAQEWLA